MKKKNWEKTENVKFKNKSGRQIENRQICNAIEVEEAAAKTELRSRREDEAKTALKFLPSLLF